MCGARSETDPPDASVTFDACGEIAEHQTELLDGRESSHTEQPLLQHANEAFDALIGLGLHDERRVTGSLSSVHPFMRVGAW